MDILFPGACISYIISLSTLSTGAISTLNLVHSFTIEYSSQVKIGIQSSPLLHTAYGIDLSSANFAFFMEPVWDGARRQQVWSVTVLYLTSRLHPVWMTASPGY